MAKTARTKDVFDQLHELGCLAEEVAVTVAPELQDQPPRSPVGLAPPPGRQRRRVLAALSAMVLIGVLGMSGFFGWRLKELTDVATAGQAALAAAQHYAVTLTTLDTNDIDSNYQQVIDGATGDFRDQFSKGSAQLRQLLVDNRAMGEGIVVSAAVKSMTKTEVHVLLFVDQSITNAVNPIPRIDRSRVEMTMELVDNRWLASRVEMI